MKKNVKLPNLAPIEPQSREAVRAKNSWATSILYLQDLRTNKTKLFQQLQIEIQALHAEQDKTVEEQQAMKADLLRKVANISKVSADIAKVKAMTGFSANLNDSVQEGAMVRDLFMLIGLLELYSAAYLEADTYFARQNSMSSVVNPPTDRLICYLQLVKSIKKPLRSDSRSATNQSNGARHGSAARSMR